MKLLNGLTWAVALLPTLSDASWFARRGTPAGCAFTISSAGSFACPAGELSDGQIRLNGSEPTATFYIDSAGGITDANGFGCIVTDPPTTQVQCDQGASPMTGFSIDSSDNLLYHGSPTFWACPATDTEYNIYVNPDFGQTKCFTITLKASGCGAAASPSTCAPPSTVCVTQTQTVTENVTQTVTVMVTSPAACAPSSVQTWNSSTTSAKCHKCTESSSSATWTSLATKVKRSSPYDSQLYGAFPEKAVPVHLAPRASNPPDDPLYLDWRQTYNNRNTQPNRYKWVLTGGVEYFDFTLGQTTWVGTNYFYGCTVFAAVGAKGVVLGHYQQEQGSAGKSVCALETRGDTQKYLISDLEENVIQYDIGSGLSPVCGQRYAWIMGSTPAGSGGTNLFRRWFVDNGIPNDNVRYVAYGGGGTGEPDRSKPAGLALVKWTSDSAAEGATATLQVYFSNDTPRIALDYVIRDGQPVLQEVDPSTSDDTSVGAEGTAPGTSSAELKRDDDFLFA